MRIAVFSAKSYDERFLTEANAKLGLGHELVFLEPRLTQATAPLAEGADAVCAFVNDDLSAAVLRALAARDVRLALLRCAGFNQVDLACADELGVTVARVPAYSPHAVADHAVGLLLALNRRIHRAHARVREGNFSLEGLMGREVRNQTVGAIGTGAIGEEFLRSMHGFGCELLAADPRTNPRVEALGARYTTVAELFAEADVVSLHCPLTPETFHLVDAEMLARMRPGAMLINTSRGALVDTHAVIESLKSGRLGALGLDVYEEEADLFFEDLSERVITDDTFMRLVTFPNVLITGHQAFFTEEALEQIAATTLVNASAYAGGEGDLHVVTGDMVS